ncbi:MAG: hypothetical protein AABX16_03510 [Nanoarchaeota archaeon]
MLKKRVLFSVILVSIFILQLIAAQNSLQPSSPQPTSPLLGEINPQTGQPKNLETLQKYGDYYSNREQNKSLLLKEWTKIFANNKYIGPPLFYTEKFFSFFNSVWQIILGAKFSWSLAFFVIFAVWIGFIIGVYYTINSFFNANQFITAALAVIIASLVGISGGIKQGVELLAQSIPNIWVFLIVFVLVVILFMFYMLFIKDLGEKFKENQERKRKDLRSLKERAYEKILDTHLTREGL